MSDQPKPRIAVGDEFVTQTGRAEGDEDIARILAISPGGTVRVGFRVAGSEIGDQGVRRSGETLPVERVLALIEAHLWVDARWVEARDEVARVQADPEGSYAWEPKTRR